MKGIVKVAMMVLVVGFSLMALQCPTVPVHGMWRMGPVSGDSETFEFTATALNIIGTGTYQGLLTTAVDSHDVEAGHIRSTVTDAQEYYMYWSGIIYWTYAIISGQLWINYDFSSFPADATAGMGPYDRN